MLTEDQKTLLSSSPWASIILDTDSPEFSINWINPAGLKLTQASSGELLGTSIFDLFTGSVAAQPSKADALLRHALGRALSRKSVERAGIHHYTKPGTIETAANASVWNLMIYPVCDPAGEVLFLVVNPQIDISQQTMSGILESITDGFYAVDRDWIVTYWNKEAERILQRPREAIIGMKLWDAYPVDQHAVLFSAYQEALSNNVSVQLEIYYDPMETWIEISVFPAEGGLSIYFKDINDRKQAEEKLNEAKKQYQELFDYNPLPQWVYRLEDYKIIYVNQAAIDHYGYSKEEFLSMNIRDLKPRDELKILEDVIATAVKTGFFPKTTGKHVKKSGEIIDVQVEGNQIIFEGKPSMLVLAVDVTAKSLAERALKASEQKFKALVQDGSDLLTILDADGIFLYANHTTIRILEFTEDDFVGKYSFNFVHEEDRERVKREFYALDNEHKHKILPYRFRNGWGGYLWLETIITNMTADPAVRGVVANSRDITSRMAIEQRMQESIERFNIVSKATSDAVWDFDPSTGMAAWSEVARDLFGFSGTMQTREWWRNRIHPDDREHVLAAVEALIQQKGRRLELEYRFRCEDGGYKHILDRSFLVFNESGILTRMIGSMQDMTERVKYLHQLEAQNEHLKEIAWTQSHVVRAPLARIMAIADLLSSDAGADNPNAELIAHLAHSAAELDNTIRELVKKTEQIYKS